MTLLDFWPTNEAINACMPSEAEAIAPAAFLAVHQPIRLLRRSLGNPSAPPEPADEQAVLDALLTPDLPEGYVVVPVVGRPGVGKSHLITWLGLHVAGERRVVVTIPKSTSLRKILEDILGRLTGGEYDDVRRRLATSQDALDNIAAEEKLLAEFRIALRRKRDEAKMACDEAKQSGRTVPPDQRAIAETHGDGLIALLEGPTKEALLTGNGERSVFRALIRRVRTGKIDAENGQFTAADLNLDPVKLRLADGPALKYLKKLKSNVLNEREAAAGLLNAVRDKAVELLLGLGENQLADLFRRVRTQLLADGKELVLLIEDFTTLAGVQGGLLDVMKMEGVQKGKAVLCPLRTALAVTDGFLSEYGTVTSRIGHDFVLREQPAGDVEVLGTITDLVGAYLNAARIGAAQLQAWFHGKNGDPNATPPSFEPAAGQLTAAERTQLAAFGQSSRGHSLFPFNREAVRHLADQHLRAEGGLRLNPRDLIKHVLQPTLRHNRDTFERKQFPPDGFHSFKPNQLGADVGLWVDAARKADAPRYKVLLGYWGDRPKAKDDVRLPAGVYTAFGLTPLTDVAPVPPPVGPVAPLPPPPVDKPDEPTEDDKLREKVAARVRVFDEWATSRKISQPDARSLRNDLLDMIGAAIDWDAELLAGTRDLTTRMGKATTAAEDDEEDEFDPTEGKGVEKRFPPEKFRTAVASDRVYLPFTGSKTADADDACFVLCREEEFDTPAFSAVRLELRALVRFHTYKSFDYDGGDEDRGWYAGLAERAVNEAKQYIRKRYERVPDDEAAAAAVAQALYVSARVLNLDGAHSSQDADVVAAVLHPGPGGFPPKPDDPWHGFRQACATNRTTARDFLLRRLAARQGGGGVLHAIDAARLLKWIAPVRKSCRVEAEFPGTPTELGENARQVRGFVAELGAKRTESAVGTRRDALRQWADTTRTWLGSPFDKKAFVGECEQLLNQAKNLGVFRADVTFETLRQHRKEFDEAAVSAAIDAVHRLKDDATPSDVLRGVVQAPDDAVRKADTFRTGFQRFVELTLADARTRFGQKLQLAGGGVSADPSTLLPAEGKKLDADLRAILAACGAQPAELTATVASVEPVEVAPSGRFADLAAALDRLSRVDTVAQQLKELESPRSAVNGWATDLTAVVRQHQLFGTRGGVSIDPPPVTTKVANAAEAARTAVAQSPLGIAKGRTFKNLEAAVKKVLDEYHAAVKTAWETWVDRTAPRVTEGELTPFEKHEDYSGVVTQIRTKLATLKRSRNEPAESEADFDVVEGTAAALRTLLGQLPTEAPTVVKAFLFATNAKDGAPLDLLTPEVLAWLRANKQLDKYRIWR